VDAFASIPTDFADTPTDVLGPDFGFDVTTTDPFAELATPTDVVEDPSLGGFDSTIEPDWSIDATTTADAGAAEATDNFAFPDFDATGGALDPGVGEAAAPDETSTDPFAFPEETATPDPSTDLPGDGSGVAGDLNESSSTLPPNATVSLAGLVAPDVTPGTDSGAVAGDSSGLGAQDAGGSSGSSWTGEDASNYDGQDYGEDDSYSSGYEEECPSYCLKGGDYPSSNGDDSYPADDSDYSDYPMIRRIVRRFTRRQGGSGGGFAAFQWPSAGKKSGDDCDDDVPDWLYQSSGKKPCKPKCPASCYYKPTAAGYPSKPTDDGYPYEPTDTYKGYPTRRPWTRTWTPPEPSTTDSYSAEWNDTTETSTSTQTTFVTSTMTWEPEPYPYPSEEPYPYPSEEPYPYPSEEPYPYPSEEPYPSPDSYPSESYPSDAYSSESADDKDWTGETLATVCPKQCNPFDPAANKCDITSSCTTTGKGKYYCACRAGYRASAWNAKDFSKQFKFEGQPYVYTAEGVVCDKVCSDQTCTDVLSRPLCQ
jgi:hypothetical protein